MAGAQRADPTPRKLKAPARQPGRHPSPLRADRALPASFDAPDESEHLVAGDGLDALTAMPAAALQHEPVQPSHELAHTTPSPARAAGLMCACLLLLAWHPSGARGQAAFAASRLPCEGVPNITLECRTVEVPLDRTGQVPGTVSLFVQRIVAPYLPRFAPLFYFSGGPGDSATFSLLDAYRKLLPILGNRDLVAT